jgi:hypothetical protein
MDSIWLQQALLYAQQYLSRFFLSYAFISMNSLSSCSCFCSSGLFSSTIAYQNYGTFRLMVEHLERVISPVARSLPTQEKTDTKETRTELFASSQIRTHDTSV